MLTFPDSTHPGPHTLNQLGATDLLIRRTSDGVHTVTLHLQPDPARFVPATGQRMILHDPAGNQLFQGRLTQAETTAQSREATLSWIFEGPNWLLERFTFLQPGWMFPSDLDDPEGDLTEIPSSRVILHADPTGAKLTIPRQIDEILNSAISQGAEFTWDTSALPALRVPEEERQNLTILAALRLVLRWLPHCHLVWDLSGALPHLRFVLTSAPRPFPALENITHFRAARLAGFPLPQLQIRSFRPVIRTYSTAQSDVTRRWLEPADSLSTAPTPPASSRPLGKQTLNYFLRGPVTRWQVDADSGESVMVESIPAEEPLSADLATWLHAGFQTPAIELRATLEPADPDLTLAPGDALATAGLTALDPALNALPLPQNIVVHDIETSLATGKTTLHAGPPPRPDFWDLQPLLTLDTLFTPPISTSQRATGEGSRFSATFGEETNPDPQVKIYGCVNGQPVYYLFRPSILQGPKPLP